MTKQTMKDLQTENAILRAALELKGVKGVIASAPRQTKKKPVAEKPAEKPVKAVQTVTEEQVGTMLPHLLPFMHKAAAAFLSSHPEAKIVKGFGMKNGQSTGNPCEYVEYTDNQGNASKMFASGRYFFKVRE